MLAARRRTCLRSMRSVINVHVLCVYIQMRMYPNKSPLLFAVLTTRSRSHALKAAGGGGGLKLIPTSANEKRMRGIFRLLSRLFFTHILPRTQRRDRKTTFLYVGFPSIWLTSTYMNVSSTQRQMAHHLLDARLPQNGGHIV